MLNLGTKITLSQNQKTKITNLGILTKDSWNHNKVALRDDFYSQLVSLQDSICVYCGCPIYGAGDVEHIAHKALYPQFMFTPDNVALACKTCNQTYKGAKDTIQSLDSDYNNCSFLMVHPYFDDVDHYFDCSQPVIRIKSGLSTEEKNKAKFTKELLHWKETDVTEKRAMYISYKKVKQEYNIPSDKELVYENILTYLP